MKNKNITTATIVRTICLFLALINQMLLMNGHTVLPIGDDQIEMIVGTTATVVLSLIAWWKNNSFTRPAIQGDEVMHQAKKIARLRK